jgi:hypothetical protein
VTGNRRVWQTRDVLDSQVSLLVRIFLSDVVGLLDERFCLGFRGFVDVESDCLCFCLERVHTRKSELLFLVLCITL